jgi:uncharacterized membrane protein
VTWLRGQLFVADPMNLNQVILAEGKNVNINLLNTTDKKQFSQTKRVALTGVMAALIAVTTIIAIPLPPPLSTINLAPVIIFVVCILLGPILGVTSTVIGCGIGYLAGTSLGTIIVPPGFLYIYLVGLVVARGPMALTVGVLRKKSEVTGMVLGVIIETAIFFSIDFVLFGLGFAVFDLGTFVDLVFVPITVAVLIAVRRILDTKYLS